MGRAESRLTFKKLFGGGRRGQVPVRKKPAAKRAARKPAQGATRNTAVPTQGSGSPHAWLNRMLILLGTGVVLVAATKGFIVVQSVPVQRITVTGELEHTQAEAVQDMVQPSLVGGFLGADLQQMRRQLEALPWIYEATVRRKWPNALEISVVEQLPIARWGRDGGDWESLPLLTGPEGTAQSLMAKYQRLVEMLAPLNLSVAQLSVDERGQMEAVLAQGMELIVGSNDFLGRMHRFAVVYRSELAARKSEVVRVDLRYENGIAVAFSEPSQVAGL